MSALNLQRRCFFIAKASGYPSVEERNPSNIFGLRTSVVEFFRFPNFRRVVIQNLEATSIARLDFVDSPHISFTIVMIRYFASPVHLLGARDPDTILETEVSYSELLRTSSLSYKNCTGTNLDRSSITSSRTPNRNSSVLSLPRYGDRPCKLPSDKGGLGMC